MKLVAIDFETADLSADSACAIGIVSIEKGKITKKGYRLIRPPRRHFIFSYIHGISWADVEAQPTFNEVWDHFASFWKNADYFLAHNAPFDRKVMTACCSAAGRRPPRTSCICTVRELVRIGIFDRQTCQPYVPSWEYRLSTIMPLPMHWPAHRLLFVQ